MVGIETGNPRQSGANRGCFHADLAIPYQRQIDIRLVPIFPNSCLMARANPSKRRRVFRVGEQGFVQLMRRLFQVAGAAVFHAKLVEEIRGGRLVH